MNRTVKDFIFEEWLDDERKALDFEDYTKVGDVEFEEVLESLDLDDVEDAMEDSQYVPNHRFFFFHETAIEIMAQNNGWDIINGFTYNLIEKEEE